MGYLIYIIVFKPRQSTNIYDIHTYVKYGKRVMFFYVVVTVDVYRNYDIEYARVTTRVGSLLLKSN